jgi:hypothetical protein
MFEHASSQKYGFGIRDPRSEIRNPKPGSEIPGTGKNLSWIQRIKKAPDHGSGYATLATIRVEFFFIAHSSLLYFDYFHYFQNGSREAYGRGAEHC